MEFDLCAPSSSAIEKCCIHSPVTTSQWRGEQGGRENFLGLLIFKFILSSALSYSFYSCQILLTVQLPMFWQWNKKDGVITLLAMKDSVCTCRLSWWHPSTYGVLWRWVTSRVTGWWQFGWAGHSAVDNNNTLHSHYNYRRTSHYYDALFILLDSSHALNALLQI